MLNLFLPFKTLVSFTRNKLIPFTRKKILPYYSQIVERQKTKVEWKHHNIELNSSDNGDFLISKENVIKFLDNLDKSKNYVFLICILSDKGMHMAPKSKIENINFMSSPETLSIRVNFEISTIIERYDISSVDSIVFRYREFVSETIITPPTKFKKSKVPIPLMTKNNLFSDYYAPFSMDKNKFGKLILNLGDIQHYLFKNRFIIVREFKPVNDTEFYHLKILNKLNNDLIIEFIDMKIKSNHFIRNIEGYKLEIKGGKISMFESTAKYNNISPLSPDSIHESEMNNIISYDIECYRDEENKFVPYAVAWYINGVFKLYYSTDYGSPNLMILESFRDLLIKENKNRSIYIHNNKKFDSIFIINALLNSEFKLTPVYKDDLALSLSVTKDYGSKNSIKLIIKDSYLVLPSSLRNLCKDFQVDTQKDIFPHSFASLSNLNYIGATPPFEAYPEGSFENLSGYKEYFNNNKIWNFKEEALKYLLIDVKSLYEVMLSARKSIYEKENIDITKVISNASLSFKIFRTNYFSQIPKSILDNKFSYSVLEWKKILLKYTSNICIFTKKEYNYMSKAYFGGVTEVFKPLIEKGFYYDVNSLYPFVMKYLMPIGAPTFSTDSVLDNYFGVVRAEIITPKFLKNPILPVKCEDGKNRFVLGEWEGTYCSEELKFARDNFGYKIRVLDGYKFESGEIFNNFVDHFFSLKNKHKGSALGSIYKLILNSLYGRFGMSPVRTTTVILEQYQTEQILFNHHILNIRDLGDGKELVTYELGPKNNTDMNTGDYINSKIKSDYQENFFNTNVAISLFISAYARMYMFGVIKKYNLDVYYMDTDSLILDKPLPEEKVSDTEIGKFKLEYKIKRGIHAGLKLYYHVTDSKKTPLVIKAKGAGKNLSFNDFEDLIKLQKIVYPKEKWFIDKTKLSIQVKMVPLNISGGTNKRRMIVVNGNWVDTQPLNYKEIPKNYGNVITIKQDLLPLPDLSIKNSIVSYINKENDILSDLDHLNKKENIGYKDPSVVDNDSLLKYGDSNELDNLSLLSYKNPANLIVNFPSNEELSRLFPQESQGKNFLIVLNPDSSFNNFYKSVKNASSDLKMSPKTIMKYANTGILYKNLYIFIQD